MIRPTVEVILSYVDKLTAPLRGTSTGVRGMFSDMTKSVSSFVGGFLAIGSITAYMRAAWEAADRFSQSLARVEGTAKIVGVPLANVQETAKKAREEFGLSTTAANNFASSAVTMAAKAGDVAKSGELMAAVLNLAAARGISADEALEALNITLKGQDEGLDKLVQKNPSAYYDSWAKAAGRSAGSLTDLEKKLAIVDGLIADGGPVRGSYSEWLETTAGKAFLAGQAMEEANAKFGVATEALRNLLLGAKVWAAEALGTVVQFFQKIGVDMALAFDTAGYKIKHAIGSILQFVAEGIEGSRVLMLFMTDGMEQMVSNMADSGNRMMVDAIRDKRLVEGVRKEMYAEIEGAHALAMANMVATNEQGQTEMTDAQRKAMEKQREAAEKTFNAISEAFSKAYRTEGPSAMREAEDAIDAINTALMTQAGLTEEQRAGLERIADQWAQQTFLIRSAVALEEELKEVQQLSYTKETLDRINSLHAKAIELRNQEGANAATVAYYDTLIKAIVAETGEKLGESVAFQQSLAAASRQAQLAYAMMVGDVATIAQLSKELAGTTDDTAEGWYKIDESVLNAARGGISLANEMGILDDRSANVLNNVVNLVDVMQKGLGSLAAGDVIGAIGSLAGVIGGLFGESPEARAQKQLIQRHMDVLRDLVKVNGLLLAASSTGAQAQKFQDMAGQLDQLGGMGGESSQMQKMRLELFRKMLQAQGLGITDAERMAEDLGLDLGISEGKLNGAVLQQFAEALKTADFSAFSQTMGGVIDRLEFMERLNGGLSANDQLSQIKAGLSSEFGSSVLSQQFEGIDFTTAEGKQQLLNRLLGVGANIESLSPGQRGGLTGQEFTDILVRLTDLLRSSLEGDASGVPAPAPGVSGEVTVPGTPRVDVPGTPTVLSDGAATDLGSLLGGKLDVMIEQGAVMIALQERIATATEQIPLIADAIATASPQTSAGTPSISWFDEELERARNLAALTRGG